MSNAQRCHQRKAAIEHAKQEGKICEECDGLGHMTIFCALAVGAYRRVDAS